MVPWGRELKGVDGVTVRLVRLNKLMILPHLVPPFFFAVVHDQCASKSNTVFSNTSTYINGSAKNWGSCWFVSDEDKVLEFNMHYSAMVNQHGVAAVPSPL